MAVKLLLYDLETSPLITYAWQIYEADAIEVIEDTQILCFAYKWLGDKKTTVIGQDDFRSYRPGVNDDRHVVVALRNLFDQADVIIAHNGNSFDQKVSQARMIAHDLLPPTPYRQIDTRLEAKKAGRFTSNKLDDLGKKFGIGQKMETGGFATWKGCLAGDKKSWKKMKAYNKTDVDLLEQVYLKLRPWIRYHPALNILAGEVDNCKNCGIGKMIKGMKYVATNTNKYQYYRCNNCGASARARLAEASESRPQYV